MANIASVWIICGRPLNRAEHLDIPGVHLQLAILILAGEMEVRVDNGEGPHLRSYGAWLSLDVQLSLDPRPARTRTRGEGAAIIAPP